jgi:uncharacterized membrane protein
MARKGNQSLLYLILILIMLGVLAQIPLSCIYHDVFTIIVLSSTFPIAFSIIVYFYLHFGRKRKR